MSVFEPAGADWSDREVDLIVADYFDMLNKEMAGERYVKAQRNAALRDLTGRSKGSIEFKHQNISAVLRKLGMPWIIGYKPMANFQKALIDGIERYLDARREVLTIAGPSALSGFAESSSLMIEPPPSMVTGEPAEPAVLTRLVRKFDPAARDARNRALGKMGEEKILHFERERLTDRGRPDLARMVAWVAEQDGHGAGYDILSFDVSGHERLLEVKTTAGHQTTPFFLSENERLLSLERPDAFRLVRLYDFQREPRAFELTPPLDHSVMLRPINYRASFEW